MTEKPTLANLPEGYKLDESGIDIIVLYYLVNTDVVARFTHNATVENIILAAEEHAAEQKNT